MDDKVSFMSNPKELLLEILRAKYANKGKVMEKTIAIQLEELREEIAQEIESKGDFIAWLWTGIDGRTPEAIDWYINDVKYFASIARGKK